MASEAVASVLVQLVLSLACPRLRRQKDAVGRDLTKPTIRADGERSAQPVSARDKPTVLIH